MPRLLGVEEYPLSNNNDHQERSRPIKSWFGRYTNPWPETWATPNIMLLYRWKAKYPKSKLELPKTEQELNDMLPVVKPEFISGDESKDAKMAFTWLGHATGLVEFDGVAVLTDPVFSPHCATFQMVSFGGTPGTTPRFRPAPCSVADLPNSLRFVLISHNHFDHLDAPSCVEIDKRFGNSIAWCVPKGNAALMQSILQSESSGIINKKIIELDWWQCAAFKVEDSKNRQELFEIVSTPCQHWCMRGLLDKMTTLWCSWAVIGPSGRRFFFGGDTGYCKTFKEIGAQLGPFDLAALPIGAYDPHEFLAAQHIDPAEAVQVHKDIRAKRSVAIHWGTFPFADDSLLGPKDELEEAVKKNNLPDGEFVTLKHGETLVLN